MLIVLDFYMLELNIYRYLSRFKKGGLFFIFLPTPPFKMSEQSFSYDEGIKGTVISLHVVANIETLILVLYFMIYPRFKD